MSLREGCLDTFLAPIPPTAVEKPNHEHILKDGAITEEALQALTLTILTHVTNAVINHVTISFEV